MENLRILVLGDVGVGKSSFLKLITEKFSEIYPINFFDYYMHLDEEEARNKFVSAKDLAENNCKSKRVQALVESMFFQAKKNFLQFIESKMKGYNFFGEQRHKYTYGFEIFTFLWYMDKAYKKNKYEKNIPLNIKQSEGLLTDILSNDCKDEKVLLVEFLEIGGIQTYSCIRNIFYTKHDGILLVYDSSNNKSYHNLAKWVYEVYEHRKLPSDMFCSAKRGRNKFWNLFKGVKTEDKGGAEDHSGRDTSKGCTDHGGYLDSRKQRKNGTYIKHNVKHHAEYNADSYANRYASGYSDGNASHRERHLDEDPFASGDDSDIEKGHAKKGDQFLKGEIPIACVATKIDKKNAKEKPASVKTPETSIFYRFFFPEFSVNATNEAVIANKDNVKRKKEILKKLENHITQATEIKASSIDCVVDLEKFVHFLRSVYEKKYNSAKLNG
ncbi:ras GTPAse, putative [Plasmodium knowlesi strain H]|uniref:Ras GTPAse, putative n=3 Tax=Plasmodium knowlesi TaxID=5850 RepID=A0A5K1UI53_PLAKH|nr:ras GTPAse, putative [Plasmodium knowlesi strain H]OTN64411.1 putative Ras GTPAse [Plasmodium knowlesi]CAA9989158.1 ras GTPAse, putative [Plasmodium knowlesi strain H]SBO27377.1 ras GTPAse, putative [Plasmodium knowlesi strain H]SBO27511.1 ras GTPAse, putative [Plasmodium knowlesi strain H]VVS78632.1 ras GTPAse, putative [Plasmodium knowlesi strain H]|eukprot:XP_002261505.1 hypothetical protein, conserved in Plasmodium species [Plasmodium knowlesi strain H]